MYEVKYYTLAKLSENKIGNIIQEFRICYTDAPLEKIEELINRVLSKRVCVIEKITSKQDCYVIQYGIKATDYIYEIKCDPLPIYFTDTPLEKIKELFNNTKVNSIIEIERIKGHVIQYKKD